MSTATAFPLFDWDWASKVELLSFLTQSADEFIGIVTETRTVFTDPDHVDQEAAAHKIVTYAFAIKKNWTGAPTPPAADELAKVETRDQALSLLPQFPAGGKLKDLLLWAVDHWDEFVTYVLPLLLLVFKGKLPFPLPKLLR